MFSQKTEGKEISVPSDAVERSSKVRTGNVLWLVMRRSLVTLVRAVITAVMRVETRVGRTEERAEYEDSESNQFLRLLFCSEGEQGRIVAKEWCGKLMGEIQLRKTLNIQEKSSHQLSKLQERIQGIGGRIGHTPSVSSYLIEQLVYVKLCNRCQRYSSNQARHLALWSLYSSGKRLTIHV